MKFTIASKPKEEIESLVELSLSISGNRQSVFLDALNRATGKMVCLMEFKEGGFARIPIDSNQKMGDLRWDNCQESFGQLQIKEHSYY